MADIVVKGEVFSTDAVSGDIYFRTDTDMNQWYTYDGTRWLSTQVYECGFVIAGIGSNGDVTVGRIGDGAAIFIEGVDITTYVGATNDGSNYWTFKVTSYDDSFTNGTDITATFNTSSDAQADWISHDANITLQNNPPTYYGLFALNGTETGTAGNYSATLNVRYRKIKT